MKYELKIVNCNKQYWEFVRKLRLNQDVIDGFNEQKHITKSEQIKYMNKNSKFYRICLLDKKPVGYVGVVNNDLRVCTHPDFQNLGIATFMVNEIIKLYPDAEAKIKISNKASLNLFKKVGFKKKFYVYKLN